MNKLLIFLISALTVAVILTSCEKEEDYFDESLLIGKWQSGTLYDRYFADGKGYTWDLDDDVQEDEAQHFTWTLEKSVLTQIHIMETGGGLIPKVYTVTELSSARLRYRDKFLKSFSFNRVN
jgi:hypothetical protein